MSAPVPVPDPWPAALRERVAFHPVVRAARHRLLPLALTLAHSSLPLAVWEGPARPHGRPGRVLVAGKEPWVGYLPERIFLEPPRREHLGRVPLWALPRALRRLQSSVDLVVARVDRLAARWLFGPDFLHVPEWVGSFLRLSNDLDDRLRANGSVRADLRRVRNQQFQVVVSRQEADFLAFYEQMYRPYIQHRHPERTLIRTRHELQAQFRQGGILWVERHGTRVAGALLQRQDERCFFRVLGTTGDPDLARQGALAAVYYHGIEYARQQGCTWIDLGTSRGCLQDGVLRYKSKWGGAVEERPANHFELLLRWRQVAGLVGDVLAHSSPIFRGNSGLAAVHVLDQDQPASTEDVQRVLHDLAVPGLSRFYLVSRAGWAPAITAPPNVCLVDGRPAAGRPPASELPFPI